MMDRVEILASRLRRLVSRTRWSTRLLGYPDPTVEESHEPGLVLIQIDGLGDRQLREALASGKMPFLNHLVEDNDYRIHRFYSGLPSSTPGFQAEFFYGVRTAVPAFGYRDAELDRVVSMNDPGVAAAVEERLRRRASGLFQGGSAWSNLFTGDAAEPHFCASAVGLGSVLRAVAPWRLLGLALFHTWSVLRVLANFLIETVLALWDFVRGSIVRGELRQELKFVPLRVAVTAVMREIIAAGACVDAGRGLPVVQINFLGYDEHAHRRGPDSRFALWTLRGIDRAIRRVYLAAARSRLRDYQVWFYSDHGQEATVPYPVRFGEDVSSAVERVYRKLRKIRSDGNGRGVLAPRGTGLGDRSRWIRPDLPERVTRIRAPEPPAVPEGSPTVVHQGPVGFVYLDHELAETDLHAFGAALAREAHIPMVLAHDGVGGAWVWAGDKRYRLPLDAVRVFGNDHPHLEAVTEDMLRVVCHEDAGSLVIAGWNRERPLSLQLENGAHGGPGPNETSPMLVLPPEMSPTADDETALRPRELRNLALRVLEEPHTRFEFPSDGNSPYGESADRQEVRIRVMSYNVHGCRGMDGKFSPDRVARVIARVRPDIICLQELDQDRTRSGGVDQVDVIASQLQAEYHFHAVAEVDDGRFGNAVLSSYPLHLVRSGALPALDTRMNLEQRGVLWVEAEVGTRRVQILNTHLSIREKERRLQADTLVGPEWLGNPECRGAIVLTGDFNTSSNSYTARLIQRRLTDACALREDDTVLQTWSSRLPVRRIDHIFLSPCFSAQSVHVPRTRLTRVASDHLPLVADVICRFGGRPAPRNVEETETAGRT